MARSSLTMDGEAVDKRIGPALTARSAGRDRSRTASSGSNASNEAVASVLLQLAADLTRAEHPAVAAMIEYALVEIEDRVG